MTRRQQWVVAWIAVAIIAVITLILNIGATPTYDIRFQSCDQAREAGAPLPLTPSDPGWNVSLDPDNDGQAC